MQRRHCLQFAFLLFNLALFLAATAITLPAQSFSTIYDFCTQPNCTDGGDPMGALIQGTDGNFYGTTAGGGAYGDGTFFKMTPGGTLTTLHSFDGTDGSRPNFLVQATDGNFYGIAEETIFKITPGGTLTTLHRFDSADGYEPMGGLVQGTDGNFYGTTSLGGPDTHVDWAVARSSELPQGAR